MGLATQIPAKMIAAFARRGTRGILAESAHRGHAVGDERGEVAQDAGRQAPGEHEQQEPARDEAARSDSQADQPVVHG